MKLDDNHIQFILDNLQSATEDDELEFKGAKGGFPGSFWETYSAFANTDGGVIILGVKEKDERLQPDMLTKTDIDKLQKDLWSGLANKNTINLNLLNNDDVKPFEFGRSYILVVCVPRANRDQRPIHTGLDPYGGTYRRGYEGDFKCTRSEVLRMFADADITRPADNRILVGYTFDDIDKESLRQYRQLFSNAKPDHIWSTLDDMAFLKQLGAYRKDRRTGEEGFTVAGILMFGKSNAIIDDECLPNFFPDYRNETTTGDSERWIDRIYPDGTWEANLFQFYLRTLPRLQSFLPKPFNIKDNQRVDHSPAHVAIREVFVNLCVHPDYKAEGSLSVVFRNGTYIFSNPGTMLVSQEQFFEGGESVCRNPTLQKMFMMLGPAEKAGSGGAKIIEGWRRNNWTTPLIIERSRPDKVEFRLSMQSLMQPEVVDELNDRFGIDIQLLPSQEQTVLALALTEGLVTNERLRWVLWMHKSDITALLQSLCRKNLLTPEGYGRGTKYSLSHSIVQRPAKKGSSEAKEGSSEAKEGSSEAKEGSSEAKEGSSEANFDGLSADVLKLLSKKRHSRSEMTSLVRELCTHWRTPQELSQSIHKDLKYLKDKVIPMLLESGVLEREYPGIPNHPNQRYRNKQ